MAQPIRTIDINCDVGEASTSAQCEVERQILPLVTSANIACGLHAGSPDMIRQTIIQARQHGVAIGAHPGFPDRPGSGRQDLSMPVDTLEAYLAYQIGALMAVAKLEGASVSHVKPHGALYNMAAWDPDLAMTIAGAVAAVDRGLILIGLAGSRLIEAGEKVGLRVAREIFADRAYHHDGRLVSRQRPDALLSDEHAIQTRLHQWLQHGRIISIEGSGFHVSADTICVHADTPGALPAARMLRQVLTTAGVVIRRLGNAGT